MREVQEYLALKTDLITVLLNIKKKCNKFNIYGPRYINIFFFILYFLKKDN